MVAAWISALTGVGPSIASGNQTCSGNCPDLPTAPQKIRSAMNVALAPSKSQTGAFKTAAAAIVKKQCAAAIVEPEHSEKESDVADARGDERFLCRRRRARSLNPESDEQIGREPDQFPKHEEQEQAVRDNHAEHRGGEEREIREEAGEILVVRHVADAEDKNAQADERDHHQHGGRERIEDKAEAQRLFAEREPGEILDGAEAVRLQRRKERHDRDREHNDLTSDCERGRAFAPRIRKLRITSEAASGTAGSARDDRESRRSSCVENAQRPTPNVQRRTQNLSELSIER